MSGTGSTMIYRCNGLVADCGVTFQGSQSQVEALAIAHAERDHAISGNEQEMAQRVRANISELD
jgi:predicted small metal-binding protein